MFFLEDAARLKEHTVSRKSERLVSLTIALLATKRFLTKAEIFAAIEGYDGDAVAKERMFERDKEDLRNLGIEIEVGSFDPLFEDEAGYRIRSDRYQLQIDNLTPLQIGMISLASMAWQNSALDSTALSALVKLKALGVESDLAELPQISPRVVAVDPNVEILIDALTKRQKIAFFYLHHDLKKKRRVIEPYGAGTKNGFWYVAGRDVEKAEERVFRVDRIQGEISKEGKVESYLIPQDFSMQKTLESKAKLHKAILRIQRGKAHSLMARAEHIVESDDCHEITIAFGELDELLRDVLWHLDDVTIIEPHEAVNKIKEILETLVAIHG